ncbi:MAG: site-2 protease family protein [bacterium]
MFIQYLFTDFQLYITWIVIVIISAYIHQLAHAAVSYKQTDLAIKRKDYFSFNPVYYLNYMSLILLVLFGMFWDSFDMENKTYKHKYSKALVSLAGPLASLVMVFVFSLLYIVCLKNNLSFIPVHVKKNLLFCFQTGSQANAVLALFTLIPLPPLEGSHIAKYLIPAVNKIYEKIGNNGYLLLFLVLCIIPGASHVFWTAANLISDVALVSVASIFNLF